MPRRTHAPSTRPRDRMAPILVRRPIDPAALRLLALLEHDRREDTR